MNLLREKQKLMPYGNPMMDGGGGGGGTQTTVNEVPEWARDTAQRNLSKAEALTSDTPYQSYGSYAKQEGIDPNRVAGFTDLQNQSFRGAQNLQPSQALNPAMGLAGAGAMGSLGAGRNYMNMATDPSAMQGFMSPYMQNVVNSQMQEANRNYDISGTQQQGKATQAGAFGGSRGAIMAAENERNRNTALGGIQAQGLQSAFQNAQQAQQFGANLGLQGFGQAIQGAGQLANIGNQQFGQQKDALALQNQFGGQQQANEQAKLGYNMQDYAAAKQYPYQQLSFLSNILRGTPMGGISTMYGAQPTMGQTLGSLGLGAYGVSQLAKADGGIVSSYADGGSVDSSQNIESIVNKLSDPQLKQAAEAAQMRGDVEQLQIIQQEMAMRASERGGMAGAFNQLPQEQQEQMMAGGGIVAFQDRGYVDPDLAGDVSFNDGGDGLGPVPLSASIEGDPTSQSLYGTELLAHINRLRASPRYTPMTSEKRREAEKQTFEEMERFAGEDPYGAMKKRLETQEGDRAGALAQGRGLAALQAAAAMSQGRGLAQGLGRASGAFAESYGKALQADSAEKRSLAQMQFNLADAQRKERLGLTKEARASVQAGETAQLNAINAHREREAAIGDMLGKGMQATRPVATRAPAASQEPKGFDALAAAEFKGLVASGEPPNDTTRQLAFRNAANLWGKQTGEARTDVGLSGVAARLQDSIATAKNKVKITPQYLTADAAGKKRMEEDAEAAAIKAFQAAKTAASGSPSVNTNPTSGSGKIDGLPPGAIVRGNEVYDSTGKLIGHVR